MPINDPNRRDPVEILARVGSITPNPRDAQRAFHVWVDLTQRAGWVVTEDPGFQPQGEGTEIGSVIIEGLSYRIHYGLRYRQNAVDDSTGAPTLRAIFKPAAWAEPVTEGFSLW
jgi:hypothetical protein